MSRIKVIIPVCTPMWNEPVRALMEKHKSSDTTITVENLDKGPETIDFAYDKSLAELPVIEAATKAEDEGYDGVIIYCFGDPGLAATRERLAIPVVGLCEPSIYLASMLGERYSVMVAGSDRVFRSKRLIMYNRFQGYGMAHKCASVRPLGVPILELENQHEKKLDRLVTEAKKAIEQDGADTIVLGCGGILNVGQSITESLGIPVIVPALAALKLCESLIAIGLHQSKLRFPFPAER